jgi:hypothetical protein
VPRLLLTGPVRVTALVVQFFLDLALLFGHLPGVRGLGIRLTADLLVHARSFCRLLRLLRVVNYLGAHGGE